MWLEISRKCYGGSCDGRILFLSSNRITECEIFSILSNVDFTVDNNHLIFFDKIHLLQVNGTGTGTANSFSCSDIASIH